MFFFLSKTLDLAFSPLTWAMALVIAGRAPARKWLWRGCLTLAVGVLYLFSIQPVSNALERHLEAGARSTMKEGVVYDGVVLLGGIVDVLVSKPDRPRACGDNSERLLATYDLLRTGLAREVLVSSGNEGPFAREAQVLRQQLIDWGIAPERAVIEDQSRNTRENAIESARVARERGWTSILVVTSAFHMERALGCFKAVGLEVDALPVDPRAYDPARFSEAGFPESGTSHRARTPCTRWPRGSSIGCSVTPSSRSRHIPVHRFIQAIGDRVAGARSASAGR